MDLIPYKPSPSSVTMTTKYCNKQVTNSYVYKTLSTLKSMTLCINTDMHVQYLCMYNTEMISFLTPSFSIPEVNLVIMPDYFIIKDETKFYHHLDTNRLANKHGKHDMKHSLLPLLVFGKISHCYHMTIM